MVSWYADGEVSTKWNNVVGLYDSIFLASAGMVDVNFPTRIQYNKPMTGPGEDPATANGDYVRAVARINFTTADINALTTGQRYTATMFVASANSFAAGVTPTPAQILALPVSQVTVWRSTNSATTTGDKYLGIQGPRAGTLGAGQKYWVLVCPTKVTWGNTPSIANDALAGGPESRRGLSITTNHTPVKPVTPTGAIIQAPGTTFTYTYDSSADLDNDPAFLPSLSWNVTGIQVQKAAVPADPATPLVWSDVLFRSTYYYTDGTDDSVDEQGWFIQGAGALPPFSAAQFAPIDFMDTSVVQVMAGWPVNSKVPKWNTTDTTFGAMILPEGDWYLRTRTFDPGGENSYYPINYTTGTGITPDTYPAYNKSPWSDSLRVIVPPRVPPPVPISPRDSVAVPIGSSITLDWDYRNSYTPPATQKTAEVRLRIVNSAGGGVGPWYTPFSGATTQSAIILLSTYGPITSAGRLIEWQVRVTDTADVVSAWSESALFWLVPVAASGPVRPTPTSTIKAGSLGCGNNRAFIYRRGGKTRVGEITGISHLDYGRVRDDISDSTIEVTDWGVDCGNLLARLQCWAYEVVIFRDNGFSVDRVWEGPITLLTYEEGKVTIQAKDPMAYAYRRIIKQTMNDTFNTPTAGRSVVARATQILQNAFAPDDPNVLGYINPMPQVDDPKQYRALPAYSRTAFEEVDDMAANAGLDYTTVGRRIMLWATKYRIGTLPEFRDKDLGSVPVVSEYGMRMANHYATSDGNGVYGAAVAADSGLTLSDTGVLGGSDPKYGLIEMLASSWASDTDSETGTYTQAGLIKVQEGFRETSKRAVDERYPSPVVVRIPDNTTLNPSAQVNIQQLVPGVAVPLRSTGTLRSVVAVQKLDSVRVVQSDGGDEVISITLSPFSHEDDETEEG